MKRSTEATIVFEVTLGGSLVCGWMASLLGNVWTEQTQTQLTDSNPYLTCPPDAVSVSSDIDANRRDTYGLTGPGSICVLKIRKNFDRMGAVPFRGRSSPVECLLAKEKVAGSIPVVRSKSIRFNQII